MAARQAVDDRQRPASPRIRRKRDRRRQAIVEVAATLFGEHGYDAVSLDDVADRLDVTKGSLYYYFASKEELGTAAIETLGNEWTRRLEELAAEHAGSTAELLRALLHRHITIAVCEYPAALRLFLAPDAWPAAQAARIKRLRTRHDRVFRAVLQRGVEAGEFTVLSVDTTLQCLHAAMSQAPLWCGKRSGPARRRAIDELADTLMMLAGPTRRPAS